MLVGAGCVGVWESCWCGHELYGKFGGNLARKIENKEVFYEDWAHVHALYRLAAGAKGVPFLPTYSAMGSDILNPENLPGPLATQILADFGAEVIKIEDRKGELGDFYRQGLTIPALGSILLIVIILDIVLHKLSIYNEGIV